MNKLENFIAGRWLTEDGDGQLVYDAVTGDSFVAASTKGIDMPAMLHYARKTGNANLRRMTFHDRGRMLRDLALHLLDHKEKFYSISYKTGATKAESWVDIEGGIGNLFAYASLRRKFLDLPYTYDSEGYNLSKMGSFMGHHLMVPKEVAIHTM